MGSRAPALMRAFPGSMNSALLSQPPKMTRELVPQCPRGTSFLRHLPLAMGEAGREGGSAEKLPWPWTSFSGVRVGEEERACSLEGLGAPGRQEKGMGRPWLGSQAWRGQPSGGRLLETPPLGALGPVFQSVEKYCKKSLQGGAGSRPGGADGEERKGPF